MKPIRLFWLRQQVINFGDDLSPIIVERMSGREVRWASLERCQMVAIGSLLERVFFRRWKRMIRVIPGKLNVWGTGAFGDIGPDTSNLIIHAVRGPQTREALQLPDATPLGDPALLLSRMMDRSDKRYRCGVIPHIWHQDSPEISDLVSQGAHLIDLRNPDIIRTASEIGACDFVVSSSLHGIIAADAVGVPNVWMSLDQPLHGGDWKFRDYFASVRREVMLPVVSPFNLRKLESIAGCAESGVIDDLCDGLEASFRRIDL